MKVEESRKHKNSQGIEIVTNYKDAVNWLHNHYVLCNNIEKIDNSIYENMQFDYYIKECPHCGSDNISLEEINAIDNYTCNDCEETFLEPNEDNAVEIYQWYLTDASKSDVEYLKNRFRLKFTYSELLDVYVLCVTHYRTAWDYVGCQDAKEGK